MNVRVGSLFTGIGGIELGFERAGFTTVWAIEKDPYARAILRERFPYATLYGDVTTVDFGQLARVDVITAGFPCQDISNAGNRAGITGHRSGLWKYCIDALRDCRPRVAVFENVAALTRRGLDTVLCDLAAIGHAAEWHCVPAASVGAPHRRDRIFILAYPDSGRHVHGQPHEHPTEARQQTLRQPHERSTTSPGQRGTRRTSNPTVSAAGWWALEPAMGRVAHGVPHWLDRIKCLGNAVVPAVSQAIAQSIKDTINRENAELVDRRTDHHG